MRRNSGAPAPPLLVKKQQLEMLRKYYPHIDTGHTAVKEDDQRETKKEILERRIHDYRHPKARGRPAIKPSEGHVFNPLCTLPRNMPCPCGGRRKFKQCCLPDLPKIIAESRYDEYEATRRNAIAGIIGW